MSALLRFERVALRRGGRLLFEDLGLELGPATRFRSPDRTAAASRASSVSPRGFCGLSAARSSARRLRSPTTISRSTASFRLKRALHFWGGAPDGAMEALGIAHLAPVPVRLLSSGQAKRATLARVAASGAPLWLLDEPLNALDATGAAQVGELIGRHLESGGAVLAASHQPLPGTGARWRSADDDRPHRARPAPRRLGGHGMVADRLLRAGRRADAVRGRARRAHSGAHRSGRPVDRRAHRLAAPGRAADRARSVGRRARPARASRHGRGEHRLCEDRRALARLRAAPAGRCGSRLGAAGDGRQGRL